MDQTVVGTGTRGGIEPGRHQDSMELRALQRWVAIQGEVLRGLAHAMSNRVATLSAGVFMLGERDATRRESLAALQDELERLDVLLQQLRMVPGTSDKPEPVIPGDSARLAVALHAHDGELRPVRCEIVAAGSMPPIAAESQPLLHALLVALNAARQAVDGSGHVQLRLESDGDVVRFVATTSTARSALDWTDERFTLEAMAAGQLLQGSAGRARAHSRGCVLELPTLAAARMADRANASH